MFFLCFDFFLLWVLAMGDLAGGGPVTSDMWHLKYDTWYLTHDIFFPVPFQSVSVRFGVGAFYPHKSLDSLSPVYMLKGSHNKQKSIPWTWLYLLGAQPTELLKAEDIKMHVYAKLSRICAKFRLLRAKLLKMGTDIKKKLSCFYCILADFFAQCFD